MRGFHTLANCFWGLSDLQALSPETRLIALYLMTGPHTRALGCFYCPKSYVVEDLKISGEPVRQGFQSLSERGMLRFDPENGWVLLPDFFRFNTIQNNNQGRHIEKLFQHVPKQSVFMEELVGLLQAQEERLSESFKKQLAFLEKRHNGEQAAMLGREKQAFACGGPPSSIKQSGVAPSFFITFNT